MSKGQGCKVFVGGLVRCCLMRVHEYNPARLAELRNDSRSCQVGETCCRYIIRNDNLRACYQGNRSSARLVIPIQSPLAVCLLPGGLIGCPRYFQ